MPVGAFIWCHGSLVVFAFEVGFCLICVAIGDRFDAALPCAEPASSILLVSKQFLLQILFFVVLSHFLCAFVCVGSLSYPSQVWGTRPYNMERYKIPAWLSYGIGHTLWRCCCGYGCLLLFQMAYAGSLYRNAVLQADGGSRPGLMGWCHPWVFGLGCSESELQALPQGWEMLKW